MAAQYACEDADVIVLQRGAMPDTFESIVYWKQRGKIILADIDDGYPQITQEHPAWAFWHRGIATDPMGKQTQLPKPAIQYMAEGLRMVDGLTSPNRIILADWQLAVGVHGEYLPNYLPVGMYASAERTRARDTVWVAWGGSAGHFVSFQNSGILYALARVMAARPHTRFVMAGADLRIVDAVPLRSEQKINLHFRPMSEWPGRLEKCDIGLIPAAGEFDARRSWLKPLEYALCGVPYIASKSPAYAGLEAFGEFVDNTPDAWVYALETMLERGPDLRKQEAGFNFASAQNVYKHADDIVKVYERFMK